MTTNNTNILPMNTSKNLKEKIASAYTTYSIRPGTLKPSQNQLLSRNNNTKARTLKIEKTKSKIRPTHSRNGMANLSMGGNMRDVLLKSHKTDTNKFQVFATFKNGQSKINTHIELSNDKFLLKKPEMPHLSLPPVKVEVVQCDQNSVLNCIKENQQKQQLNETVHYIVDHCDEYMSNATPATRKDPLRSFATVMSKDFATNGLDDLGNSGTENMFQKPQSRSLVFFRNS